MNTPHSRNPLCSKGRVLVSSLVLSMLLLVGASLGGHALPGGSQIVNIAHASGGGGGGGGGFGTITVASGQLIARTTVLVSGTFTCAIPSGTVDSAQVSMTLNQASGRQIVFAFNFIPVTTTCDGTITPYQVAVTPGSGSAPFHGGQAVASGELDITFTDASGNMFFFNAVAGNQVIHIKG